MKEWLDIHKTKIFIGLGLMVILVYFQFFRPSEKDQLILSDSNIQVSNEQNLTDSVSVKAEEPVSIMVDVKGAVKTPGVYHAKQGERVIDLVNKSGGFTADADQNQVNLSQHVEDEMVIFVPILGETGESIPNDPVSQKNGLININKASDSELQTIPGIGPSKASSIIEYRETNGGFTSIEDIKKISGIGEKTFKKLEGYITIK